MSDIIFCGDHFGSLSQCITLLHNHKESKIFYLISANDDMLLDILNKMQSENLFEIILFDYRLYADIQNAEKISNNICEYFQMLLKEKNIDINKVDEIFVSNSGAYCSFEIFLMLVGKEYTLVEFSQNEFYDRRLLYTIEQYKSISTAYKELITSLGAVIGNNKFCKRHIYIKGSKIDYTLPGKISVVDFSKKLKLLPIEYKRKILNVYSQNLCKQINDMEVLLLTNSESLTKKALSNANNYVAKTIAPYTILMDIIHCNTNDFVIKPHPYGNFDFETYFDKATIINKAFPIEFVCLIKKKIKQAISIETSATEKISNIIVDNIKLSRFFMLYIHEIIDLYCIIKMIDILKLRKVYLISSHAESLMQIVNLMAKTYIKNKSNIVLMNPSQYKSNEILGKGILILTLEKNICINYKLNPLKLFFIRKQIDNDSTISNGTNKAYILNDYYNELIYKYKNKHIFYYSKIQVEVKSLLEV